MAGHSQFKNIMHRKGQPGFHAFENVLQTRARNHRCRQNRSADPAMNAAPASGYPERQGAVHAEGQYRACHQEGIRARMAENYEEVRYEGYGPGGDRRHRRSPDRQPQPHGLQCPLDLHQGWRRALGETGSVSFSFDHVGEITYKLSVGDADKVMEAAIEAGAEDVDHRRRWPHHHLRLRRHERSVQGAGSHSRRGRNRQGHLACAEHDSGGRRARPVADEAASTRWKTTTTCRTSIPTWTFPTKSWPSFRPDLVRSEGVDTPLCPAGHLPHWWGDRIVRPATRSIINALRGRHRLPISPRVGEMSGRTEGFLPPRAIPHPAMRYRGSASPRTNCPSCSSISWASAAS